jgi:hypothetical protein
MQRPLVAWSEEGISQLRYVRNLPALRGTLRSAVTSANGSVSAAPTAREKRLVVLGVTPQGYTEITSERVDNAT